MLTTTELQFSVPLMFSPSLEDNLEVSRLLAAAVVNPTFCRLLLADPQQALETGYKGETFLLSEAARYLFLLIHADTLVDLAKQIAQAFGMGQQKQAPAYAQSPVFMNC